MPISTSIDSVPMSQGIEARGIVFSGVYFKRGLLLYVVYNNSAIFGKFKLLEVAQFNKMKMKMRILQMGYHPLHYP